MKRFSKCLISIILVLIGVLNLTAGFAQTKGQPVKHIILFIGDGMHNEHERATSLYLTGKEEQLVWNRFPYHTYVSTWDINTYNNYSALYSLKSYSRKEFNPLVGYDPFQGGDKPYPLSKVSNDNYFLKNGATDSAAAATAFSTGVKTESQNLSWLSGDPENGQIKTIAEMLKEKGFAIGLITTVPFNHATPAAFVAHNVDRNNYHEIAEEIIKTGKPDVIIGGGHPNFDKKGYINQEIYRYISTSKDYILVEKKRKQNAAENLLNGSEISIRKNKKLFGLFGGNNGDIACLLPSRVKGNPKIYRINTDEPNLAEMSIAALNKLSTDLDGFFLLIEQGNIDWANHVNDYKRMVAYVWDLNNAVETIINFIERPDDDIDWSNTLIIVTSDHANSYMRLNPENLPVKGELPLQLKFFSWFYPTNMVKYRTHSHTNELVNLYARGAGTELFKKYEGKWYPGTRIIDNTHIFEVLKEVSDL